jgi:hypothetical protein
MHPCRSAEIHKGHIIHFRNPKNPGKPSTTSALNASNESAPEFSQQQKLPCETNQTHQSLTEGQTGGQTDGQTGGQNTSIQTRAINQNQTGQADDHGAAEKQKVSLKFSVVDRVDHSDYDDVVDSREEADADEIVYTWEHNPLMVLPNQFIHCEYI